MPRRTFVLAALMVASSLLALAAHPQPGGAPSIVGQWLLRTPEMEIRFEAKADGHYSRYMRTAAGEEKDQGTYRLANGVLELKTDAGETLRLKCKFVGNDQLAVTDEQGNGVQLVRQAVAPAQAQDQPQAPAGKPAVLPPPTAGFKPPLPLAPAPGGHIIFTRGVPITAAGGGIAAIIPIPKLFVMSGDGSGQKPFLAPGDFTMVKEARWAPGYKILCFSSDWAEARSACVQDIFLAAADGSGLRRLTGNELVGPAPKGYGAVTGVIRDNTKQGDAFHLEKPSAGINITAQGADGLIVHPGDAYDQEIKDAQTKEKLREERWRRFYLPKVAAGTTWIKIWATKHMGHLVIAPIKADTINDLGEVELNNGNYFAGKGIVTPDGRYAVGMGGIASVDTNAQVPIANAEGRFDPNNRTTTLGGTESLCVYDGATGLPVFSWDALKMGGQAAKDPALSPDGRTVALACGQFSLEGLALVDLQDLIAGRPNPRMLVPGQRLLPSAATAFKAFNVSAGCPAWSPDGRTLVFTRVGFGEIVAGDLWVVNADGSGLRQLTSLGPQKLAAQPCFSPDGKSVAFTLISGKTGFIPPEQLLTLNVNMNVYAVDLAGGAMKQLTTDNGSAEPAWGL